MIMTTTWVSGLVEALGEGGKGSITKCIVSVNIKFFLL
jgi:hypothetical protein